MKRFNLNLLSSDFIDKIPLVIMGFDQTGELIFWNSQAQNITGYTREDINCRGMPSILEELVFVPSGGIVSITRTKFFDKVIAGEKCIKDKEVEIKTKNGDVKYISWQSHVVTSTGENASRAVVFTGKDISSRKHMMHDLSQKERYIHTTTNRLKKYLSLDAQTGLVNYRHFIHNFNNAFLSCREKSEPFSLILFDIEYLSSINKIHGFARGNQLLKKLATIISANISEKYTVGKFSGSEFAIMLPGADTRTAFSVAGKLFAILSNYRFKLSGSGIALNLSFFMALGGAPHCEGVKSPESLLDRVERKLKEAKRRGDNSILICPAKEAPGTSDSCIPELSCAADDYRYTVEFVNALANTVKTKDLYTREHSSVMSNYATKIADHLGLSKKEIRDIRFGSILHDIGKIGIDKMILLKPGSLTNDEFEAIKQHPRVGAEIIRNVHPLKDVVPYVLYHHERYDGNGYLCGLSGEDIPLGARIISLSDVYQALTSDRPYRKALRQKDAFEIIKNYSGEYFDPKVVKAFFEVYQA